MAKNIRILIVEDEMIIGATISLDLSQMGYEVTAIIPRGVEALNHIEEERPDMVLLDIQLKGSIDGIETGRQIKEKYNIPIIYLTANNDQAHFDRAKTTKPEAFIAKPYNKLELQRAIELAVSRKEQLVGNSNASISVLDDRIFIRHQDKHIKLETQVILFLKSDRNYSVIVTEDKEYILAITLKTLLEKLPNEDFLRVHRSYAVNIGKIDSISDNHLVIKRAVIPISKAQKPALIERFRIL